MLVAFFIGLILGIIEYVVVIAAICALLITVSRKIIIRNNIEMNKDKNPIWLDAQMRVKDLFSQQKIILDKCIELEKKTEKQFKTCEKYKDIRDKNGIGSKEYSKLSYINTISEQEYSLSAYSKQQEYLLRRIFGIERIMLLSSDGTSERALMEWEKNSLNILLRIRNDRNRVMRSASIEERTFLLMKWEKIILENLSELMATIDK